MAPISCGSMTRKRRARSSGWSRPTGRRKTRRADGVISAFLTSWQGAELFMRRRGRCRCRPAAGTHWDRASREIRRARHSRARFCRRRSVPDTVHCNIENQILEGSMAWPGLLVVRQECRDIKRSLAALVEKTQPVVPALDDHVLSDNELERFVAGAGHIGFENLAAREQFPGIADIHLFTCIHLGAAAGILHDDIGPQLGLGCIDTAVGKRFLDRAGFPGLFPIHLLATGSHHRLLGRENIEHFHRDGDIVLSLHERRQLSAIPLADSISGEDGNSAVAFTQIDEDLSRAINRPRTVYRNIKRKTAIRGRKDRVPYFLHQFHLEEVAFFSMLAFAV